MKRGVRISAAPEDNQEVFSKTAMDALVPISLSHVMTVSVLLAAAGVGTILTKRHAMGILIGVELLLNAAALNFVASGRWLPWNGWPVPQQADGLVFAIFIIVLAAAEAATALAIFLNFYHRFASMDVEKADQMKG